MPRFESASSIGAVTTRTVEDVISSLEDLDASFGPQAEILLEQIANKHAPQVLTGVELRAQLQATRVLPTGCKTLDTLLRGGVREGHLTELCGDSGSGKTQLCMTAAAVTAARAEGVVYIDTGTAVSAARLQKILNSIEDRDVSVDAALGKISIARVHTIHQLLYILDYLLTQQPAANNIETAAAAAATNPTITNTATPKLIIVDSVGSLVAPILAGTQHTQGHTLLSLAGSSLKAIAKRLSAVVLVTNHLVGGGGGNFSSNMRNADLAAGDERWRHEKRPALGESWQNQPHLRIRLALVQPPDATFVQVGNSRSGGDGNAIRDQQHHQSNAGQQGVVEQEVNGKWVARVGPCTQVSHGGEALFTITAAGAVGV